MLKRTMLVSLAILAGGVAEAAPLPPGPPPVRDRKELRSASRRFAQQLWYVIGRIADQYVRPVKREDLLEAAVTGLYESARRPVPPDLRSQIRQAVNLSSLVQADTKPGQVFATGRPEPDPVEKLLVTLRERLGDAPGLEGADPLVVACRPLSKLLDAHSGVVTAAEQKRVMGADGANLGTGLEFRERLTPGPLTVEQVHQGGPAQRVGLRPGDVVTHIDGRPLADAAPELQLALRSTRTADDTVLLARPDNQGEPVPELPATLRVTYRREGVSEGRTVTLLRERYRTESVLGVRRRTGNAWDFIADERQGLGYVRVTTLARGTSEEVREALSQLQSRKVRGVVLDLRWCPGGYLNEAVETADLFLGTCVVPTTRSRGREDTVYRSTEEGKFRDFPLVVLVNGETMGGAELVAAALQDHKRAVVVGQRTHGKASVQVPLSLGLQGTGFKLTTGTFVRPSGKNLHRFPDSQAGDEWGVVPDEDCRVSPELGQRLKQWWLLQSLRPPVSRERLPLDVPGSDPQQREALAVLRDLLARKK